MRESGRGIELGIFVVGVPRSGTTLVQSLLAAHPAVTSFTESHLFARHFLLLPVLRRPVLTRDPVPRLREFLAENGEPPPEAASRLAATRRTGLLLPLRTAAVARQLLRVFDQLALRRGRSSWVEKTPRHLRYLPFLDRVSRGERRTRHVHVIRGGLETVASLHRASRSWERPYDLATCVRRWNADVGFSLRRVGRPHDHFVFYEKLTAEPEATLRRLLAGLGLDWEPAILERYAGTADRLVTAEEEGWKRGVGRAIRPSEASAETLTAAERRLARSRLASGLYERLAESVTRR